MVKRKIYSFKKNKIIEVEEFHDGNYGAPGKPREKKKKATEEQIKKINQINKSKNCRHRLLEYFSVGDLFVTLTYEEQNRPPNMEKAVKDFQQFRRKIAGKYKKAEKPLYWIRNIEQGTRGAWHIHLIINEIGNTATLINEAWPHGGTYIVKIGKSRYYDEDFSQLANYITKDENVAEKKKDGTLAKPRIRQASYSTSRNMPLRKPHCDKLLRWKDQPKPKKGYVIIKMYEGINPVTGYMYRRYTMAGGGGG